MRVLIFGASGMIGQGVLRECLHAKDVDEVMCVVRAQLPQTNRKLGQVVQSDVGDLAALGDLGRFNACFFPLGVSSAGMSEADYTRLTHDLTLRIAKPLAAANPSMTFIYVSGAGTDSSGTGRSMWARVKGRTENAILAAFPNGYAFRPGVIQALDGIRSRTPLYNRLYAVLRPVVALTAKLAPKSTVTTRSIGHAMLHVARHGFPTHVLEAKDINVAAQAPVAPTAA